MNDYSVILQLSPYINSLIITIVLITLSYYKRNTPGAISLVAAGIGEVIWIAGAILEITSVDISYKVFYDNVQFIGMFIAPFGLLSFSLYYTRITVRYPRSLLVSTGIIVVLLSILVFSDPLHHLIREDLKIIHRDPFSVFTYTLTPVFSLISSFSYLIILASAGIIVTRMRLAPYRNQSLLIMIGVILPVIASFGAFFEIKFYGQRDLTPISFGIANVFIAWGFIRRQFMDLVPVARDKIIDDLDDAVIILDSQDRIVDCNRLTYSIFNKSRSEMVGSPVTSLLEGCPDLANILYNETSDRIETKIYHDGINKFFDISVNMLSQHKFNISGRIISFHDITRRYEIEELLRRTNEQLEKLVEERTREIAQKNEDLRFEILGRKEYESQLKQTLAEKEVLLKEVHHRVKNNLQIIVSLISIEMRRMADEQDITLCRNTLSRIRTISMIHEMLYYHGNFSRIDFSKFIKMITRSLRDNYKLYDESIKIESTIVDCILDLNLSIPIALIMNEILSNSYKHAFPGNRVGTILVDFKQNGFDGYVLTISDNGIGFPTNFDPNNAETLGLELIYNLVKQINGTIELNRDNGTSYTITFSD